MGFKLCCTGPSRIPSTPSTPAQPPPAPTPQRKVIFKPPHSNPESSSSPPQVPKQTSTLHPTGATPDIGSGGGDNIAIRRRQSSFTSPAFDMVSGRTPLSAWHTVAAKVVAANRFRGVGGESVVEDFKIDELGGQSGKLVFGPVAIFNGNISLRIKKPLKGMTLTVTFSGIAEVDKHLVTFLSISHDVYAGEFNEGLRTFLFGFNFPYLNLPPTSRSPHLAYSFIAKLTDTNPGIADDTSSVKSRIFEYKSKPLEIVFIPYIDPSLHSPHIPRTNTRSSSNESNGKGKGVESIKENSANNIDNPANGGSARVTKPKLTLTTADLPLSASSNSTPIIDKPRSLDSSTSRSTRVKDDDNNTVAKLTVDLPKTKFLPDEEILLRLTLTVQDGRTMPKGFGVRVVESRFLARIDSESDDEECDSDDEEHPREMKIIGKKQSKVLTGRKFILHPENATTVKQIKMDNSHSGNGDEGDLSLRGGKEIELPIKIRLPTFQTFINDFLLPTTTLPLGPPNLILEPAHDVGHIDGISDPVYSGKGKSPAQSPVACTPATTTSISLDSIRNLNFVVSHILQVTIPISGSGNWFKKSTSTTKDLEIAVPIVLGNINPLAPSRRKMPELRLNALEEIRYGSGVGSSRSSAKSGFGSTSGVGAPSNKVPHWREGERFLTLKETDIQPFFVNDS